jgi:hypothetical protein
MPNLARKLTNWYYNLSMSAVLIPTAVVWAILACLAIGSVFPLAYVAGHLLTTGAFAYFMFKSGVNK